MTRNKSVLTLGLLVLVLLSLSTAAIAPALKFTFKDVIAVKGALETDSYGINDAGVIAGDYADSAGNQHGMLLAGKKLTKIDITACGTGAGATGISFYSVNKSLQAAGWCTSTTSGQPIAFVWAKGKTKPIAYPKATATQAYGINDAGDVVGDYIDSTGTQHSFLFSKKKYTTLKDLAGVTSLSTAWSINNKGVITVFGLTSSGYVSGYTANKGKSYKTFKDPRQGANGTVIHAINNKGDIDGTEFDGDGSTKGTLLHGGKYYEFDEPNSPAKSTRADGLNDKLQIVGRYTNASGGTSGFFAQAK